MTKFMKNVSVGLASVMLLASATPIVDVYAASTVSGTRTATTDYGSATLRSTYRYVDGSYAENVSMSDTVSPNSRYKGCGTRYEKNDYSTTAKQIYEAVFYVSSQDKWSSWCQIISECDEYGDITTRTKITNY